MVDTQKYKKQFLLDRENLFNDRELLKHAFKFCSKYSLLVEEYIINIIQPQNLDCVIAAVGSFSRRELSPYSDIDLMFIFPTLENHEEVIKNCITILWDAGIEVSHSVREFSDIERFMTEDLHAFTQFFETRFLLGNKKCYDQWNEILFQVIESKNKQKLIFDLFADVKARYTKYGHSPKTLEPNIKFTGGGLRDIHSIEWMYSIKNKELLSGQNEITQTENLLNGLFKRNQINNKAFNRLFNSYSLVLRTRNYLHLLEGRKNDRLEFAQQEIIAEQLGFSKLDWKEFMHEYFRASTILNRFSKTMMKRYKQEFSVQLSDYLIIDLDDDFEVKGNILKLKNERILSISEMMRAFYYRCKNNSRFEKNLRSLIIESIHLIEVTHTLEATSSVFFRELLKLPTNVSNTLLAMNEFSFLDILLPDFKNLNGFFQPGVYHCYTSDEHSLIALQNLEELSNQDKKLTRIFNLISSKDLLYIAVLLHDIGKPISISGHEIIGAEIATSIMQSLGYGQSEILFVQFLIKHHLVMEQVALRRDLNDPATLDNFVSIFPSIKALDHLYLLTYADLSAVNPQVWTQWKAELLHELYVKAKAMLIEQLSGEELISAKSFEIMSDDKFSKNDNIIEHLDQVDDLSYVFHFSQDEINEHVNEIEKGSKVSVFFKKSKLFTNVSVITKDSESLLAKLCGILAINDLNIHDAKIFTRKDGIVIDSFSATDFRSRKIVSDSKFNIIEKNIVNAITDNLNINEEFEKVKTKWKRIINQTSTKSINIKIDFEEHDTFTIIDICAPDKIGLLYTITHKMSELGLTVSFAKISTKADEVIDSFYIQKNNGEKLRKSEYEFIRTELTNKIKKIIKRL